MEADHDSANGEQGGLAGRAGLVHDAVVAGPGNAVDLEVEFNFPTGVNPDPAPEAARQSFDGIKRCNQ
jgi:hypothetical protein